MSAPIRVEGRAYFPHVEGMRGIAALYVFLFHIWQIAVQHASTATLLGWGAATCFASKSIGSNGLQEPSQCLVAPPR